MGMSEEEFIEAQAAIRPAVFVASNTVDGEPVVPGDVSGPEAGTVARPTAAITNTLLQTLNVTFQKNFRDGLQLAEPSWQTIATVIQSSSSKNVYGWLGQLPQLREWVGAREIKDISTHGYEIPNKLFESTLGVSRVDLEDDNYGHYSTLAMQYGEAAALHDDELVWRTLAEGATRTCFDGQNFFDTEHPVYHAHTGDGEATLVSNFVDGTGPAWYLLDTTGVLKPIIYQERDKVELEYKATAKDSDHVFMLDEHLWGVRVRNGVGYGFWQKAYCSRAPLTYENLTAARAAMKSLKANGGRPLNIRPNLLVVPPELEADAEVLLKSQMLNGSSNVLYNAFDTQVSPWLG